MENKQDQRKCVNISEKSCRITDIQQQHNDHAEGLLRNHIADIQRSRSRVDEALSRSKQLVP